MFVKYRVCMRKSLYVYVWVCVKEMGGGRERGRGKGSEWERGRSHSYSHVRTWGSEVIRKPAGIIYFLSGLVSGTFTHWAISAAFTFCFKILRYRNLHRFISTILLPSLITQLKWFSWTNSIHALRFSCTLHRPYKLVTHYLNFITERWLSAYDT